MTRAQFAIAVGVNEKWLHNASAALGRRIPYTRLEACRLFIVRAIQREIEMPLRLAYRTASKTLADFAEDQVPVTDGPVQLMLNMPLLGSLCAARWGIAERYEPRRRGRRSSPTPPGQARARAKAYGIDLSLVYAHLAKTPNQRLQDLDANVAFYKQLKGAARPKVANA